LNLQLTAVLPHEMATVRALVQSAIRGGVVHTDEQEAFVMSEVDRALLFATQQRDHCIHLKCNAPAPDDNFPVGVILVKHFWNLTHLFVSPRFQRRGIGSMLLNSALSICRSHAPDRSVKVHSSYFAVPFYEARGFKRSGLERDLPGGCVPMVYVFDEDPIPIP